MTQNKPAAQQQASSIEVFKNTISQLCLEITDQGELDQAIMQAYRQYLSTTNDTILRSYATAEILYCGPPEEILIELIQRTDIGDDFVHNVFFSQVDGMDNDQLAGILALLYTHRPMLYDQIRNKAFALMDMEDIFLQYETEIGHA